LATPNLGIRDILDKVISNVESRSAGKQIPQKLEDLRGNFVFIADPTPPKPPIDPTIPEKTVVVTPTPPTKPTTRQYLDLPFAEMVHVEGGTFQMGDTRNEGFGNEKPVHTVTVSSFLMGKYEVTQRQWKSVMGNNPSYFKDCPDCPVENVSWGDTQEFLKKLNARTGGNYRLPTEAEWEYVAGGGNTTNRSRFGNGQDMLDPAQANFDASPSYKTNYSVAGEYRRKTVTVGSFVANPLGLYNLSGNVWEWCSDWYGAYSSNAQTNPKGPSNGADCVVRGGSWNFNPQIVRIAYRFFIPPTERGSNVGFRVVSQIQ
jgi:formylglycine-generating enzyme required for sulfatase activity